MTKNQTLRSVTDEYLQSVVINCFDDIDNIEKELLAKVHEAFDEHNIICDKNKKWKMPDALSFSQIAKVMNKIFNIRVIDCTENDAVATDCLLGIFVDDYVAKIIENDRKKGIYLTDDVTLDKVAQYFNNDLTRNVLDEIHAYLIRNLLPFQFLHDLYVKWYEKNVDSKSTGVQGKIKFTDELLRILNDDDQWYCEDKNKQHKVTKDNMSASEPLIARYHLTDWMAPHYKGTDINKISMPALNTKYRGIQRVMTSSVTEEDED